jgi:hypothetical protein
MKFDMFLEIFWGVLAYPLSDLIFAFELTKNIHQKEAKPALA